MHPKSLYYYSRWPLNSQPNSFSLFFILLCTHRVCPIIPKYTTTPYGNSPCLNFPRHTGVPPLAIYFNIFLCYLLNHITSQGYSSYFTNSRVKTIHINSTCHSLSLINQWHMMVVKKSEKLNLDYGTRAHRHLFYTIWLCNEPKSRLRTLMIDLWFATNI